MQDPDSPQPQFTLERRPTPPIGYGVFTRGPIPAGAAVITFTGPLLTPAQALPHVRCLQIGPATYMGESGGLDDYINHSCQPNLGFTDGSLTLFALRAIAAGEELTWDYSTAMDEPGWGFPCACGASGCRGRVTSFRDLPAGQQQRLRGMTLAYLR